MLPKKERLSQKDIRFLNKKARRFREGSFNVKVGQNRLGFARFAINIPARIFKSAVARNRMRRILYTEIQNSGFSKSVDVMVALNTPTNEEKAKEEIKRLLSNIHV